MPPLVKSPDDIRLGMVGMLDDNHHPFSWSAIINGGYDRRHGGVRRPGDQHLPRRKQPTGSLGIRGAKVTHIWTDDPERTSSNVAAASRIPNIVNKPEEVIGQIDAVLIPTDIGGEHVRRGPVRSSTPACPSSSINP
ncbi:MAG: hypothetical protein R3C45_07135 [Phycisphaerales bacterium]